jgi:hypothetical protein
LADDVLLNAGTGGDTIAADDILGVKYQRVKLSLGADGAATDALGGAGAVAAGVQRTTLASDDPAVVALQIIDNAVSGSGFNITQLNGTNVTMGNGASGTGVQRVTLANDSTGVIATVSTVTNVATIGTSVTPGTSAAHLGKAVDAVAGASDTGIALLAVRDDSLSTLTPVDGDYTHLRVSSTGALHVTGSAGMTQYTEDGASAGGESLCLMGAVRRDSAASSSGTDGDYSTINTDANGNLRVAVSAGSIAGIVDDAAFTPATSEVLPVGFTFDNTSPDSVDEGDIGAARMSANRNIYVNIRDNAGNERGLNIDASGQLAANVAMMNGVAVTMGNGASGTGVQRVTLANDSTGVLATVSTVTTVTNITNQGHGADDAAFTPATTRVMVAGFFADETATDSVDEGDMGAGRMTLDRKQIVTPYVHAAAGGSTPYKNLDVDETEDEIKATAGKLLWIHVMNLHASSTRYIKFYNATAANVTVGTTTPVLTFPVPSNINGFTIHFGDTGTQFDTAITVAATTGFADNDTGAPGANEVILNAGYI